MPQKVVTAGEKRFSEDGVKTFTNGNKKGGDDQTLLSSFPCPGTTHLPACPSQILPVSKWNLFHPNTTQTAPYHPRERAQLRRVWLYSQCHLIPSVTSSPQCHLVPTAAHGPGTFVCSDQGSPSQPRLLVGTEVRRASGHKAAAKTEHQNHRMS